MSHANFVGGWLETVKMSINSAKSWFAVDRGYKIVLFTDYNYVKKGDSVVFFIFYSEGYVDMTRS